MCLLYKDTYKYADNSNNHKTVTPIWLQLQDMKLLLAV